MDPRSSFRFPLVSTDSETRAKEVTRLLGVLEARLAGRQWLVDDNSIAQIATAPWITALDVYEGKE